MSKVGGGGASGSRGGGVPASPDLMPERGDKEERAAAYTAGLLSQKICGVNAGRAPPTARPPLIVGAQPRPAGLPLHRACHRAQCRANWCTGRKKLTICPPPPPPLRPPQNSNASAWKFGTADRFSEVKEKNGKLPPLLNTVPGPGSYGV